METDDGGGEELAWEQEVEELCGSERAPDNVLPESQDRENSSSVSGAVGSVSRGMGVVPDNVLEGLEEESEELAERWKKKDDICADGWYVFQWLG